MNRVQALAVGLLIGAALTVGALAVSPAFAGPAVEQVRVERAEARSKALARQLLRERAKVTMYRRRALAQPLHTGDQDIAAGYAARLAEAVYGVPAAKLLRVAECESGTQRHTDGPFLSWMQFTWGTWRGGPLGAFSPYDPVAAFMNAAAIAKRDGWGHWPVCGRR